MRNCLLPIVLLLGILLGGCSREQPGKPPPQPGETVTFTGTLIDTHCYADDHANIANDHERPQGHVRGCASLCARQGYPVGVLIDDDSDGDVWVLVTAPPVLADYMAQTVRVTGEVRSAGVLIPQRVELKHGNEWTFVL